MPRLLPLLLLLIFAPLRALYGQLPVLRGGHLAFSFEMAKVQRTGYSEGPANKVSIGLPDLTMRTLHAAYLIPSKKRPGLALRMDFTYGYGKNESLWRDKIIPEPGQPGFIGMHDLSVVESHSFLGLGLEGIAYRGLSSRSFPFLFAGLTGKSHTFKDEWTVKDDTRANGEYASSDFPFTASKLAFEPTAGAGIFLRLSPNFLLSIQYRFRYSTPVDYAESLIGTGFTETQTHLSHAAEAGVAFRI